MDSTNRRRFLATTGALLAGGTFVASGTTSPSDENETNDANDENETTTTDGELDGEPVDGAGWSMYRGGPGHAGAVTQTTGPETEPSVAWTYVPEWGQRAAEVAEPAVVDGTVYAGLTRREKPSNDIIGGAVVALDATDGTRLWRHESDCWGFRTPAVTDAGVFVGDTGGNVTALAADTGEERWTQSVGPETIPASEVAVTDRVYVSGEQTYALDPADGAIEWTNDSLVRPSVDGPQVLGYDRRDGQHVLVSVDAATGSERWSYPLPGSDAGGVRDSPPVAGDGVTLGLVGGIDTVHAVSSADGRELWDDAGDGMNRPALSSEYAFGAAMYGPGVHAHQAETGEEVWTTDRMEATGLTLAGDTLYVTRDATSTGVLEALDAESGRERWTYPEEVSEMAVAGGSIYAAGRGRIAALR